MAELKLLSAIRARVAAASEYINFSLVEPSFGANPRAREMTMHGRRDLRRYRYVRFPD